MLTLQVMINDKGVSYAVCVYDKKDKTYHNVYISFAEYQVLKDSFVKCGFNICEKDFRK